MNRLLLLRLLVLSVVTGIISATKLRADDLPRTTNSLGMVMIQIPAGEFLMGSPKDYAAVMAKMITYDWYRESAPSETPQRRVRLTKPFRLASTEVTLAQFRAFVEATGYRTDAERDGAGGGGRKEGRWIEQAPDFSWQRSGYDRGDNEPVNNVSWSDALAFCTWLTKKEGTTYRLPTEAEWEYACRAGTTSPFFWGENESKRNEYVWSGANSGGRPHPVAQLKPNAWGLFDMNGNVYEYTADGWSTNILEALAQTEGTLLVDPCVAPTGNEVTLRSASWGTAPIHCRSAFRGRASKSHRNHRDGFRVVSEVN